MLRAIILLLIYSSSYSQDEWFFNDLLDGKIDLPIEKKMDAFYTGNSKVFDLDISGDGIGELLKFQNIDGIPYLEIYNYKKEKLYTKKFEIKGFEARPYKIFKKRLSDRSTLSLIFFFDGKTGYLSKKSTSTLYANVVDDNDLTKIDYKKIASIWIESEDNDKYYRRNYKVDFEDMNYDGVRDLIIHSGKLKRILYYEKNNIWTGL